MFHHPHSGPILLQACAALSHTIPLLDTVLVGSLAMALGQARFMHPALMQQLRFTAQAWMSGEGKYHT